MADLILNSFANPFSEDRLTPEHLALLFPATFYQNDEALALHLTESCLVETTTWDGDTAIGDTAFWLKVLSTPQTDYLKQQKRAFKLMVADMCKNVTVRNGVASTPEAVRQPKNPSASVVTPDTSAAQPIRKHKTTNPPRTLVKHNPAPTTILALNEQQDNNSGKPKATTQATRMTLEAIASPTPGFGLNSYKCKLCDFATDTRERLNHHQKITHAVERPYSCEYCDYTSRYPWNIKTHIENVHLKTKRFKCSHCDFASPQACLLRRHVKRVHTNARDVKCQYCDYRTNHKDVLRRHVHMKHTGEFDHKCPHCPFGRDAKYEVEDHINAVHLRKVIYQCSECSFQTYRKITLRTHHKDHETKELLACPACTTKSIYPSSMAKHIREEHPNIPIPAELKDARRRTEQRSISDGDVDYTPVLMCKCKLCDFTCERITKLKAHVRRVHNQGGRHSCHICNTGFANKRNFKNHMIKQHPGVAIPEQSPQSSQVAANKQMDTTIAMTSSAASVNPVALPIDTHISTSNAVSTDLESSTSMFTPASAMQTNPAIYCDTAMYSSSTTHINSTTTVDTTMHGNSGADGNDTVVLTLQAAQDSSDGHSGETIVFLSQTESPSDHDLLP